MEYIYINQKTNQSSLLSDLFKMITVHIFLFYGYTSRVYNFQTAGIISLWRLFRGKKYNPLRDRIDSYSYENVHLFIGTILFTVFIFLLPTVLMYYVVMLIFQLIIIAIKQCKCIFDIHCHYVFMFTLSLSHS